MVHLPHDAISGTLCGHVFLGGFILIDQRGFGRTGSGICHAGAAWSGQCGVFTGKSMDTLGGDPEITKAWGYHIAYYHGAE